MRPPARRPATGPGKIRSPSLASRSGPQTRQPGNGWLVVSRGSARTRATASASVTGAGMSRLSSEDLAWARSSSPSRSSTRPGAVCSSVRSRPGGTGRRICTAALSLPRAEARTPPTYPPWPMFGSPVKRGSTTVSCWVRVDMDAASAAPVAAPLGRRCRESRDSWLQRAQGGRRHGKPTRSAAVRCRRNFFLLFDACADRGERRRRHSEECSWAVVGALRRDRAKRTT